MVLHSSQGDEMVLVCVPIPGKESVKSAEHVSDMDAEKPPPLPFNYVGEKKIL